jgi:hypothetical protein
VRLVEEFGERLEELVYFTTEFGDDGKAHFSPGRLDMCDCEKLHRCPNGTTAGENSKSVYDCIKTGEVRTR